MIAKLLKKGWLEELPGVGSFRRPYHRPLSERTAVPGWDGLIMLRISFFTILLLTGCQDKQVQNPVIGQISEIESPLQNTLEGMAKACFTEPPERCRLGNLQPN